jgi:hypothetical protein
MPSFLVQGCYYRYALRCKYAHQTAFSLIPRSGSFQTGRGRSWRGEDPCPLETSYGAMCPIRLQLDPVTRRRRVL